MSTVVGTYLFFRSIIFVAMETMLLHIAQVGLFFRAIFIGALLNFISGLLFEKTYLIVIKDETDLKSKLNASTLILIGSYVRKLVASYLKRGR